MPRSLPLHPALLWQLLDKVLLARLSGTMRSMPANEDRRPEPT